MIHYKKLNNVEYCRLKPIKLFVLHWKSQIKTNNYWLIWKMSIKLQKTKTNNYLTYFDIIWHYLTIFDIIWLLKKYSIRKQKGVAGLILWILFKMITQIFKLLNLNLQWILLKSNQIKRVKETNNFKIKCNMNA